MNSRRGGGRKRSERGDWMRLDEIGSSALGLFLAGRSAPVSNLGRADSSPVLSLIFSPQLRQPPCLVGSFSAILNEPPMVDLRGTAIGAWTSPRVADLSSDDLLAAKSAVAALNVMAWFCGRFRQVAVDGLD
ncbi:hypothetical protein TIFTF001_014865 [Ficus carica]|uniref:Uncharacterized protein n=1 Tax=Ficus carica TaxID=3494 RepID=A0AA88A4Q2_FICCA|nr:hypothetical protein TIFTF001_014865 [Ficus carica]